MLVQVSLFPPPLSLSLVRSLSMRLMQKNVDAKEKRILHLKFHHFLDTDTVNELSEID